MKRVSQLKILIVSAFLLGMVSCGGSSSGKEVGFPRSKTLYMAGFQWGEPNSFNPLVDWPAFPVGGNFNLMYEPLMNFNSLNGEMEPLLAKSYEKTPDVISAVLDPRAKWSDGKALTAEDVVFTFGIGKEYPSAPTRFVWDHISDISVDTVEVDSVKHERVNFTINKKRNNPLVILDFFQAVRIIPKHSIEALLESNDGNFSAAQKDKLDKDPVVSGPYNLLAYSGEKIVLKRRDGYWGKVLHNDKLPKPQYVIHPIYKSNDHFSISLQQGNLDISSTFIPRIWTQTKQDVHTWYSESPYHVPAALTMLMVNTTKEPLDNNTFRRAMAHAINYSDVKELAFSQYSPDLRSGLILPFGTEKKFYSKEDVEKHGIEYNVEKAKELVKKAGYTSVFEKGKLSHMEDANGKRVPTLFVKHPAGWTDWEAMVEIAVKNMREAGIDVREGPVDASVYFNDMPTGKWDLLMHSPSVNVTPSQPWARFESVMSSRNWEPVGEKMNENQGRYNQPETSKYNPKVDSLLRVIPTLTEEEEQVEAYRALNVIYMKDQVTLPLVYRPEQFYEFSTKNWTNFPNEENSYTPPQIPCFGVGTKALWEIKSTAKK
ncbi:MAG: ABC transporter substrate-binding protein [Chitinispirillaceae bacterium]